MQASQCPFVIAMKIYEEKFKLIALRLTCEDDAMVGIEFLDKLPERPQQDADKLLQDAVRQLREYFVGERKVFTLPLRPQGTVFQQRVWQELLQVPYGATASYADIAARIGKPKAVRAVGGANHVNPLPIVIPCHRIIGKNGSLTGYAGGLELKKNLLELEKNNS